MTALLVPAGETRTATADGAGTLLVETWRDLVVDEVGHDPRSLYVETFWLPVLGPSTTWLLRRLASYLDDVAGRAEVDSDDLARRIGIGERSGPNAPFQRSVKRAVDFQMAEWRGGVLAVRRFLPPLARRHLRRLPDSLQREHDEHVVLPRDRSSERLHSHVRRVALSLVENGADQSSAESTLVGYGFSPTLAESSSKFATLEHARRAAARRAAAANTVHNRSVRHIT